MFCSSVDRLTILILNLEKDCNFQDSGPSQLFNTRLMFSGTIYKCINFAGLSKSTFAPFIMDQQFGNER